MTQTRDVVGYALQDCSDLGNALLPPSIPSVMGRSGSGTSCFGSDTCVQLARTVPQFKCRVARVHATKNLDDLQIADSDRAFVVSFGRLCCNCSNQGNGATMRQRVCGACDL